MREGEDKFNEKKTNRFIKDILKKHRERGLKYSDIAILSRVRKNILVLFEKELKKRQIPFIRYKKKQLSDREIVREIISYLQLAVNESDNEAFKKGMFHI